MDQSRLSEFFEGMRPQFARCLDPTLTCEQEAIKAHSVQNATALSFIEEDNHICELKMRIADGQSVCEFQKVGRNVASTFTGLCGEHDAEIFRPIDTKPLDTSDPEQLFLLAYRSVTRELHATMEGAMRIQSAYNRQVERGEVPGDEPSEIGIEATQHLLKAYGAWNYRHKHFDQALLQRRFDAIKHSVFVIKDEPPILAASSFFSVDHKPWGKPFAAIALNIVPTSSSETVVVFSYAAPHSGKARRHVAPIMLRKGRERKFELSCLLIDRAENFFLSPSTVKHWSDEKRQLIETTFYSTVQDYLSQDRPPDLMLFE